LGAEPKRSVTKPSINYGNRRYWHLDFAQIPVGSEVEIRAQPDYMRPDTIEVFYEKRWICSAFAHDSARGRAVTGRQVLQAQRQQMRRIKGTINGKKAVLHNADLEIKSQGPIAVQNQPGEQPSSSHQQPQGDLNESLAGRTTQIASSQMPGKKYALPSTKQRNTSWDKALAASKNKNKRLQK
jgi:hypothetical protein